MIFHTAVCACGMENNMKKYILFDLDGTLTEPKEGIT